MIDFDTVHLTATHFFDRAQLQNAGIQFLYIDQLQRIDELIYMDWGTPHTLIEYKKYFDIVFAGCTDQQKQRYLKLVGWSDQTVLQHQQCTCHKAKQI